MTTDITSVPTIDLLAEVDRRARAAQPPRVLFFGVWPGERAGHYVHDRYGEHVYDPDLELKMHHVRPGSLYPWNSGYSQKWGRGKPWPQEHGKIWHWYHPTEPITLLASWDRSADGRGGCAASFIVFAHVTPQHGLELARAAFPKVFERIEAHIGKPVELAGEVPQE